MSLQQVNCPDCHGSGYGPTRTILACGPKSSNVSRSDECLFCLGTGVVTFREIEWRDKGREMRKRRVESGKGLRERATELGISPVQLSQMETGRIEPIEVSEMVTLPCLYCGAKYHFALDSDEANGVFNVFCRNGECEDKYAATL